MLSLSGDSMGQVPVKCRSLARASEMLRRVLVVTYAPLRRLISRHHSG
jgi:hypothetical protein